MARHMGLEEKREQKRQYKKVLTKYQRKGIVNICLYLITIEEVSTTQ